MSNRSRKRRTDTVEDTEDPRMHALREMEPVCDFCGVHKDAVTGTGDACPRRRYLHVEHNPAAMLACIEQDNHRDRGGKQEMEMDETEEEEAEDTTMSDTSVLRAKSPKQLFGAQVVIPCGPGEPVLATWIQFCSNCVHRVRDGDFVTDDRIIRRALTGTPTARTAPARPATEKEDTEDAMTE